MMNERLEQLRQAIRNENISYGELAELQSLADHIDPGDVELLEWAGVPEHPPEPYYCHDPDTGMEYWHDHAHTRSQCHDAVGLITTHYQPLADFLTMFPYAEVPQS